MSNVFSFTGSCGADAEVRYIPSGQAVLTVNVANNVGFGDKQKTMWIRVTLWGKRAEGNLKDYLKKWQQVFVSGELTVNEYTANDGTKRTNLELNAVIVDLVGKKSDGQQPPAPYGYAPPPEPQAYQTPQQQYAEVQHHAAQTQHYAPTQNNFQQPPPTAMSYAPPPTQPPYDDDIPF